MIEKIITGLVIIVVSFAIFKFLLNLLYGWIALEVDKLRREDSDDNLTDRRPSFSIDPDDSPNEGRTVPLGLFRRIRNRKLIAES